MSKFILNLSLTAEEMAIVEELAERKGVTKSGLLRHCLRVYQTLDFKLRSGEKLFLEDEAKNKAELLMI